MLPLAGHAPAPPPTSAAWLYVFALAAGGVVLANFLFFAGVRRIEATLTAVAATIEPVVGALGLPVETARVFLFGFFRRDYGAAGLFDLNRQGLLEPAQLAVAGVTLTLFVPCVAQFLVMVKERGVRTALGMLAFITPFAFGVGFLLNLMLAWLR